MKIIITITLMSFILFGCDKESIPLNGSAITIQECIIKEIREQPSIMFEMVEKACRARVSSIFGIIEMGCRNKVKVGTYPNDSAQEWDLTSICSIQPRDIKIPNGQWMSAKCVEWREKNIEPIKKELCDLRSKGNYT
ncbi:MAG TPA: hypothetical protein EYN54_11335 [Methylococcaceae bacterium]|jgi:hypothetical protein|nr:hypothetical protein [Methylococcaceae bacterium]HIA46118.1 hypothetical protein [Methylococcaceae bacterium]HIO45047.1 hypothetical protein [Methylococcales bacterium]